MKRKTSAKATRILTYGAKEPTRGLELLVSQLNAAHRYWNTLTAIELERREDVRLAEQTISEDDVLRIRELKKSAKKAGLTNEVKAQLKKDLCEIPGYSLVEDANSESNAKIREARAANGLRL